MNPVQEEPTGTNRGESGGKIDREAAEQLRALRKQVQEELKKLTGGEGASPSRLEASPVLMGLLGARSGGEARRLLEAELDASGSDIWVRLLKHVLGFGVSGGETTKTARLQSFSRLEERSSVDHAEKSHLPKAILNATVWLTSPGRHPDFIRSEGELQLTAFYENGRLASSLLLTSDLSDDDHRDYLPPPEAVPTAPALLYYEPVGDPRSLRLNCVELNAVFVGEPFPATATASRSRSLLELAGHLDEYAVLEVSGAGDTHALSFRFPALEDCYYGLFWQY